MAEFSSKTRDGHDFHRRNHLMEHGFRENVAPRFVVLLAAARCDAVDLDFGNGERRLHAVGEFHGVRGGGSEDGLPEKLLGGEGEEGFEGEEERGEGRERRKHGRGLEERGVSPGERGERDEGRDALVEETQRGAGEAVPIPAANRF